MLITPCRVAFVLCVKGGASAAESGALLHKAAHLLSSAFLLRWLVLGCILYQHPLLSHLSSLFQLLLACLAASTAGLLHQDHQPGWRV